MSDPATPMPRFFATASAVAADFLDNRAWKESLLPPVRQLAERYGVSKGTVEKALGWLEQQGRVVGEHGRGTFIVRGASTGSRVALRRIVVFAAHYGMAAGYYLSSLTQGIQEFALKRRLETVVLFLAADEARRRIAAERGRLLGPGTAAVVAYAGAEAATLVRGLEALGVPLVLVGSDHAGAKHVRLRLDDGDGIAQVLRHLRGLGRCRLAFLGSALDDTPHRVRLEAFLKAPKGCQCGDPILATERGLSIALGHALAGQALSKYPDLDALVCVNDRVALGAVMRLRELGHRVPQDVAVTGFDDDPYLVEDFLPPLTSVGYDGRELGRRALMALLGERSDPVLPVRLVVRGSTDGGAGVKQRAGT